MSASRPSRRASHKRPAIVLIVVLVVIVMLSLGAYTFTNLMLTHNDAARLASRQIQSRLMIDSAIAHTRIFLMMDQETQLNQGGLFDNPTMFKAINIVPDLAAKFRGNFSILSPNLDADGNLSGVRYGLEDESSRINLNTILTIDKLFAGAGRSLLMTIPGMTETAADSILDWIDSDSEPREFGAEQDYYARLQPPYAPKNGPLTTIEELLQVQGVTPQLLFGADVNRNGILDQGEQQTQLTGGAATSGATGGNAATGGNQVSGSLDRGWVGYLTLYSLEKNVNSKGLPRTFVNGDDLEALSTELNESLQNEEWVNYILAYRQFGPYTGTENGQPASGLTLDLSQQPRAKLTNVLDLVGSKVQVTVNMQQVVINSPFENNPIAMETYLPLIMDNLTVNQAKTIPGRININQCPSSMLPGIPGLDEEKVSQILQQRPEVTENVQDENMKFESWLMTKGIVTLEEMKALSALVTVRGSVYRAQVVGYYEGGGASARAEVVFDATQDVPRLLFWRDMSHLGRGYSLDLLGATATQQDLQTSQ